MLNDKTGDNEDNEIFYGDDVKHPIPYIYVLDVFAESHGGGGKLTIIIATPLQSDRRSLMRLMEKIESYLQFINSDQFPTEEGAQTFENTQIVVNLHKDSADEVRVLLERSVEWCRENNANLSWAEPD